VAGENQCDAEIESRKSGSAVHEVGRRWGEGSVGGVEPEAVGTTGGAGVAELVELFVVLHSAAEGGVEFVGGGVQGSGFRVQS
jgi:hypothetical protein